ncbi:Adenomatous polyposis protein 2 Adenomatous polyposis protein-like [Larimichthys crocea]|uniref:Adenomatous polyposis protein 2 Adenomatous polyposis protein-like n=1 Tax=Larimichthys crocea TaxID=215358 RepID=A0A6G0ITY3_LARCR|nr:Adenomatous polyposis protein 2 Adenomatous polyposis protein-like [Larimichthys crocea]
MANRSRLQPSPEQPPVKGTYLQDAQAGEQALKAPAGWLSEMGRVECLQSGRAKTKIPLNVMPHHKHKHTEQSDQPFFPPLFISDSSGRAKSEDDTKKKGQRSASRINDRVTWRRIRDEDVPQILKSTLPANALPLVPSPDGEKPKPPALPGKLPTILLASRKTKEVARLALLRKISATSGGDGDSDGSLRSHSTVSTGTSDSHVGGVVHFRQGSPSKAARVTPFNYTPSPMVCCLQDAESQAATINEKSRGKSES